MLCFLKSYLLLDVWTDGKGTNGWLESFASNVSQVKHNETLNFRRITGGKLLLKLSH